MTTKGKIILWSSITVGVGSLTWFFLLRKRNAVTPQDKATLKSTTVTADNSITATQTTGNASPVMYVQADNSALAAQVGKVGNYGSVLPGVTTYDPKKFLSDFNV